MSTTSPRLGDLERAVMDRLWAMPEGGTVREVHESLTAERELAYTTVMTVLDRLAKKDLVTREREGRAWRYAAGQSAEALAAAAMRAPMAALDGADRRAAMLHFLDGASPGELADLRAALAELESRQTRASR